MKYTATALAAVVIMIALVSPSSWGWAAQAEPMAVGPGLGVGHVDVPDSGEARSGGPHTGEVVVAHSIQSLPDADQVVEWPIVITYTVGLDPAVCARTSQITVEPGTRVVFCYQMTNYTSIDLTRHDLLDSHVGTILADFAYTLRPQATWVITAPNVSPTTWVTAAAGVSTATWTARDASAQHLFQATDDAIVIVVPDAFTAFLPLIRKQ